MASASEIVRRATSGDVLGRAAGALDRRAERALTRRVGAVQADGVEAAVRVEMGGFVTAVSQHHVAMASEREERFVRRAPRSAARQQVLVDSLTALAANEIDGLTDKWRFLR